MIPPSFRRLAFAASTLLVSAGAVRAIPVTAFDFTVLSGGSNGYYYNGVPQNYTLGFKFSVVENLNVTALGIYDLSGNGPGTNRQVAIFDLTGGTYSLVANTHFQAAETATLALNGYSYHDVADVTLQTGRVYAILASGYYGGDNNPLAARSNTTLNGIQYLGSGYNMATNTSDDIVTPLYAYEISPNHYTYLGANFLWDNAPAQAVPEPGTLALMGAGLLAAAAAARRRR